jgi:hypothetical protein
MSDTGQTPDVGNNGQPQGGGQIPPPENSGDVDGVSSVIDLGDITGVTEPQSLDHKQEETRAKIAKILVYLLCGIVFFSFLTLWLSFGLSATSESNLAVKLEDLKALLEIVLSPVVAVVGSVIGFYFGVKNK